MWIKIWKDGHMVKDMTVENASVEMSRTGKVFAAVEDACREWDLSKPLWLASNIKDFKAHSKTRFTQDCFVERIEFDFMEIHIIEED